MGKRICFFSIGFAHNRLVRMKYYEKIFPPDVEMFLFTTDKHIGKENYHQEWDLKRTKIITIKYNLLKLPFILRRFCKERKIDRITNIGSRYPALLFIFAALFSSTEYLLNIYGSIPRLREIIRGVAIRDFAHLMFFSFLMFFSERVIFVDPGVYKRFKEKSRKVVHLPAMVDTDLFFPKNKISQRKKLNLPKNGKIVIFVGRVSHGKGADLLTKLIELNEDIFFIVIGTPMYKQFKRLKKKNFVHFNKKNSKELVEYYSAADLGLFWQRTRDGGLGLTAEESLACGVPAIVRSGEGIIEPSPALLETRGTVKKTQQMVRKFFEKSTRERKELSRIARKYAEKYYSGKFWKDRYIKTYSS